MTADAPTAAAAITADIASTTADVAVTAAAGYRSLLVLLLVQFLVVMLLRRYSENIHDARRGFWHVMFIRKTMAALNITAVYADAAAAAAYAALDDR